MVLWYELFVNKALNNLAVQETIFIFAHDFYGKTDFKNTLYANSYTHNIIMVHRQHIMTILLAWLLSCSFTSAQDDVMNGVSYHEIATQDLLPTANIGLIIQDREGYMWYGTGGEGVCRDDGYSIRIFSSKTVGKGVMQSDEITCLCEDSNGNIWFGTRRGLYVISRKDWTVRAIRHELLDNKKINCICMDAKGYIWVGKEQDIIRFDNSGKALTTLSIGNDKRKEAKEMMLDSKGTLWITILRGGLFSIDKEYNKLTERAWNMDAAASYIVEDRSKNFYWVGTWGKGIVRYYADGRHEIMTPQNGKTSFSMEVNNMVMDNRHNIMWVSTMDDLYAYNTKGGRLTMLSTDGLLPREKKLIGKVICNRDGNIWVPGGSPHTFVLSWDNGTIVRDEVSAMERQSGYKIMVDRIVREGDYYWIYQRRTRLSLYNSRTGEMRFMANEAHPTPLSTQKVLGKCKDKAGVWTCNGKHLIHVWHEGMDIHWEEDSAGCMPNYISALNDIGKGMLLIGTEKQVMRYNYKRKKAETLTDSVGVVRLVDWTDGKLEYTTDPTAFPRLTDKHGHVWTMTETTLTETNPKTGAARTITADDRRVNVDYFTDMTLYDDSIYIGGVGAFCMIAPCKELDRIGNNTKIVMSDSLHLTTLDHIHAPQIRFAYRFRQDGILSSDTGEWTELEQGTNAINRDGLTWGDYTLEARCTDEYGRWSDTQVMYSFTIPAPWYLRWYCVLTYITISASLITLIIIRIRRKADVRLDEAPASTTEQADSTANEEISWQDVRLERETKEFMDQMNAIVMRNLDNANYDNDQLAADMGLSRSNLYRKFQKYGKANSISEYIRTIRIEEGKRLLRETPRSVTEIAYMTGFSSSQYFAKCFKEAIGMTPKEYRMQ